MYNFSIPADRPWVKTYAEQGLDLNVKLPDDVHSLLDNFEKNFAKYGSSVAITCMDVSLTYNQLDTYSLQIASYLQSLGLNRGDKVAVMMPNVFQYPIAMIGIIRAGLTLVNVNPLYTPHELEHQLNDSGARALFVLENFAHSFEKVQNKGQIKHVIVASMGDVMGFKGVLVNFVVRHIKKMVPAWHIPDAISFKHALGAVPVSRYQRPDVSFDDVAVLQYTGGTTGVAKGAMLTHKNLLVNIEQAMTFVNARFSVDENLSGKYIATALPLYHIFSFMIFMLGMKLGLGALLIPNPRDFDALTKDFAKYKPVFFPAVNTLFNALANHEGFKALNHSNLRLSLGGGMSVLPSTAEAWQKITGDYILEGYGLSETSPVATLNPPVGVYTGKIGVPFPSTDIILLDDNGREVALGQAGEIAIKGPQVMAGYYNRPDETQKVMTKDGYFKTGDIGVMDEQGFIKIIDRKKDVVVVSGFKVYPNEVEEAIASNPKVLECGVIGVPDKYSGEAVKIFIVKKDTSLDEQEIQKWARENLTGYKRPKHIEFVEQLPKSNVGKILRKELRALEESFNSKNT